MSLDSIWTEPGRDDSNIARTGASWDRLRRHSTGGVYLNFAGLEEEADALARAAHGINHARLCAVRRRYDPDGLFTPSSAGGSADSSHPSGLAAASECSASVAAFRVTAGRARRGSGHRVFSVDQLSQRAIGGRLLDRMIELQPQLCRPSIDAGGFALFGPKARGSSQCVQHVFRPDVVRRLRQGVRCALGFTRGVNTVDLASRDRSAQLAPRLHEQFCTSKQANHAHRPSSMQMMAGERGVEIVAQAKEWPGVSDIEEEVTPLRLTIESRGSQPIQIRYRDFRLKASDGTTYRAIPPLQTSGVVEGGQIEPGFRHSGFHVAPYYSPYYAALAPYAGPFYYDADFADTYYGYWNRVTFLPTREMLVRALPEGVLDPGGQLEGYVYFERVREDEGTPIHLHAEIERARDDELLVSLELPFVID